MVDPFEQLPALYREQQVAQDALARLNACGFPIPAAIARWRAQLASVQARIDAIQSPLSWTPRRRRALPSLWALASYWHEVPGNPLYLDAADIVAPYCFRCGAAIPCDDSLPPEERWLQAGRYLDRAHLVNRAMGGLDGPQNVVPLCIRCHRGMPNFHVEDGLAAIAWVVGAPATATCAR